MRARIWGLKRVGGVYSLLFLLVIFYMEVLSYVWNANSWHPFLPRQAGGWDGGKEGPLRLLLVADPQLIGEENELPFIGILSRWDSDRYLSRNYRLAHYHVQPHVVIFMGDLFDEGRIATPDQASRYHNRLKNVFHIPTISIPSPPTEYVYLAGDNDVGGENEPVFQDKVKWFNETVGNIQTPLIFPHTHFDVRLMKMNLFIPGIRSSPFGKDEGAVPQLRIALSHFSCLKYFSHLCAKWLDDLRPWLVLSADSHLSAYTQLLKRKSKRRVSVPRSYPKFLLPQARNRSLETQLEGEGVEFGDGVLRLHLPPRRMTTPEPQLRHEITVPTCSYRMGVPNMGFGALEIFANGTTAYRVLWLPSRYRQLYVYAAFYVFSKLIFTPWILLKVGAWAWTHLFSLRRKYKGNRVHEP